MRYLYLVRLADGIKRSYAYELPNNITLDKYAKAESKGFSWVDEEQAIAMNLEIPNSSGHYGIITQARTWEVTVKVEDNCIWAYWLNKWRGIREYRVKGKRPSKMVMREFETTFRLNSGIPVNHDLKFIF